MLIENACIVEIANGSGPKVGINHIINDTTAGIRTGADNNGGYAIQRLLSYSNSSSISLPDYYEVEDKYGSVGDEPVITESDRVAENGEIPTDDELAEKDIVKEELTKDEEIPLWEMTENDFAQKIAQGEKDEPSQDDDSNDNNGNNNNSNIKDDNYDVGATTVALKVGKKINVGKFTYKITKLTGKKGNVELVKVRAKYRKNLKKATIKSVIKYKGYSFKVTTIEKKAFIKCRKLKKVTIGKYVKTIKSKAFASSRKLKTVIIKGNKLKKVILKSLKRKK